MYLKEVTESTNDSHEPRTQKTLTSTFKNHECIDADI